MGTGNYFTVELFGLTTDVEVKLIETDVEEITYVKTNPIILDENTNGELRRDDFGNMFYFYNISIAEVGDKIIVKYIGNDTPVEYTVQFDEINNVGYAVSADGDRIEDGDASVDDRQYDSHWTAGDNNYFYVVYHGVETRVKVVVNHTVSDEWQSDENSHWYECTACGEKIDEQVHTAGEWIIDVEPSISTDGSMHKECTVCHHVIETQIIPDTHIAGDINGDGVVNNKDLVRLFKYLTYNSVVVNERALDVNGDKTVNNADLLRLLKYLTRWNVEVY